MSQTTASQAQNKVQQNKVQQNKVQQNKVHLPANQAPPETTQPWMADGLCRDHAPGMFFPSDGVGVDKARRICGECPVKEQCREYALTYRIEHGVWGGTSERERRRILRDRRLATT